MKLLALVLLLAACEHKPAPAKQPPPAAPADAAVAVADASPVAVAPDAMDVRDDCLQLADQLATVIIEGVQDPAQKASYVQERARMVRRTAEGCTRDSWDAKRMDCYRAAKTQAEIQACSPPPPPAQPRVGNPDQPH